MNITPKAGPSILKPSTGTSGAAFAEAKARAVEVFNKSSVEAPKATAQTSPVSNPSSISPEEFGALRSKTLVQSTEPQRQPDISESVHAGLPSEADTAPAKVEEPISSQYAILAKKEKALRFKAQQQEQALKAREEALKQREEALKAPTVDQSRYIPKDRFQSDPLGALAEAGLSYDQITQLALNGPNPQEMARDNTLRQLQEQVKALKEEQIKSQQSYEQSQIEARNQALRQMEMDAHALISRDPMFETIKESGATKQVVKLIERTFDESGILLSVEEAAQQVEEHLMEKAIRLSRLNKIQQRLKPAASTTQVSPERTETQQPQMKTLTNAVASTKPLSTRERAILAAKGMLNK